MPNQTVTTTTSKKFSLSLNDFWKGLIVATLTAPITVIYTSLQAGSFKLDWRSIGLLAASGFISYLIKNFFSPSVTQITPAPGQQTVTVEIPAPGKTLTTQVPDVPDEKK